MTALKPQVVTTEVKQAYTLIQAMNFMARGYALYVSSDSLRRKSFLRPAAFGDRTAVSGVDYINCGAYEEDVEVGQYGWEASAIRDLLWYQQAIDKSYDRDIGFEVCSITDTGRELLASGHIPKEWIELANSKNLCHTVLTELKDNLPPLLA